MSKQNNKELVWFMTDEEWNYGECPAFSNIDEAEEYFYREVRSYDYDNGEKPIFLDRTAIYAVPKNQTNGSELKDGGHVSDFIDPGDLEDIEPYFSTSLINPPEPESDHEHQWDSVQKIEGGLKENPGVWGHGGGVIVSYHCKHPGCYVTMTKDTWAQNPATGQQGYETVVYGELDEDDMEIHDEMYGVD